MKTSVRILGVALAAFAMAGAAEAQVAERTRKMLGE